MIIRKYKLFEEKLQTTEELGKLLDLAIETDELEFVEFFVNKGARSTDETMEKASWEEEIFRYLLEHKYKLNLTEQRLNDDTVQKILIDFGKHKYILENLGYFNIKLKRDEKYKNSVDNFYKSQGPSYKALEWAKDDKELFLHFLKEGGDYKELDKSILKEVEVQKALIDFGKYLFVSDIGFNSELADDPKYKKWLDMGDEFDKFNL